MTALSPTPTEPPAAEQRDSTGLTEAERAAAKAAIPQHITDELALGALAAFRATCIAAAAKPGEAA